jgi:trans-2,3-dihydro-3-hydroxyanthranilate isomerase
MKLTFYTADAFTSIPFHGAPIAVFPEAGGLNDTRMQLLAREMNLPGTVFVLPPTDAGHFRRLRIFTPAAEIDFGSHAVIAAAHVLAATGALPLQGRHTPFVLRLNGGPVQVFITGARDKPVFVQFSQRTRSQLDRFVPSYQELAEILSLAELELEKLKYSPLMVSCGYPYLIVPLRFYDSVRKARFNHDAWGQSSAPATFVQEILLFTTHNPETSSNFHGRLVGPRIGLHDDPPIGSAMPAFAHYLCAQPHVKTGTHAFTIDRGLAATRQSFLSVEMDNKGGEELTIRVGGLAVMVCEGQMTIPD